LLRGRDTEFVTEETQIPHIMAYHLRKVALEEMGPDHEAVCTFS